MSQSPFAVQPIDDLGRVDVGQEDFAFEDAIGEHERGSGYASFLGASITTGRIRLAALSVLLVIGVFVSRAAYLQVVRGSHFFSLAEGNRVREERLIADRGLILDRTGTLLASNVPAFTLWLDREVLEEGGDHVTLVTKLSELLALDENGVHDILLTDETSGPELLVTPDMSHEAAMRVLASPELYPGLRVESGVRRAYHAEGADTLSSLLGYTGIISAEEYEVRRETGYRQTDLLGKIGIEQSYEDVLRGFPGERSVEVDAVGREQVILSQREAVDGSNLVLHIDKELQSYIEERLDDLRERTGIKNASIVALDPRDGGIRALVSYPGYDANVFTGRIDRETYAGLVEDEARPLFTRAYSGQYPSGSTFKPIVAALALDEGVIEEHTRILSTGGIRIGQFYFPDWKAGGHGSVTVREAIANSVNTFFYVIGGGWRDMPGLGLEKMMAGAARFGLGTQLGLDVPGEAPGFLPTVAWKQEVKNEPWYIGDTYHVAIGQGDILVTPLQVAMFTSVFANEGILYQPQVVDGWETQDRWHDAAPVVLESNPASKEAIEIVKEGLGETVSYGSGVRLRSLPVSAAGKTGTAQWHSEKANHAWFTGFAPYEEPELVLTVLIEEGGEGSSVAVPVAYDILNWWFTH